MSFSLIIPVFNEEESINNLFKKLKNIKEIKKDVEIILVDDCSTDKSYTYLNQNSSDINAIVIKMKKTEVMVIPLKKGQNSKK